MIQHCLIVAMIYDQVPFHRKLEMWVPTPILDNNTMLTLIERQNKTFGNKDWTIIQGRVKDKCKRNAKYKDFLFLFIEYFG